MYDAMDLMPPSLRVIRHRGPNDRIRDYNIVVDDVRLGTVAEGGTTSLPVTAGTHSVHLTIDWCRSRRIDVVVPEEGEVTLWCQSRGGTPFDVFFNRQDYIRLSGQSFTPQAIPRFSYRLVVGTAGMTVVVLLVVIVRGVSGVPATAVGIIAAVAGIAWLLWFTFTPRLPRWAERRGQDLPS